MITETQAAERIHELDAQAATLKSEIRRFRARLRWTLDQREQFVKDCENVGIKIILKQKGEEGDLHGRNKEPHH